MICASLEEERPSSGETPDISGGSVYTVMPLWREVLESEVCPVGERLFMTFFCPLIRGVTLEIKSFCLCSCKERVHIVVEKHGRVSTTVQPLLYLAVHF